MALLSTQSRLAFLLAWRAFLPAGGPFPAERGACRLLNVPEGGHWARQPRASAPEGGTGQGSRGPLRFGALHWSQSPRGGAG